MNIERALGVSQLILPAECVDRKKSVLNIYPEKIGVVYRKSLGVWNFILILNKKDASNIDSISSGNIGKYILISVNGGVVAKAILNSPIVGQRIYVSVDSEKDGDDLADHFMAQASGKNAERRKPRATH